MSAFIGALRVTLGIDTAEFQEGIKGAQDEMRRVGQSLKSAGQTMSAAVTAPLIGFGAWTLKVAGDFEASMNQVRAVSGATGDDLKRLRDQAKELGATTQFSVTEAADAMNFLAMAGLKTEEILGAMPSTLQLASAAQLDMASAADIVTNILSGYNMGVDELGHATDVLVQAFTNANTDLRQLGEAMKYAAPVASAAGVQFEEAAAALGIMGNNGIQASMAGTSLRGAISRILSPTKKASELMAEAGLRLQDFGDYASDAELDAAMGSMADAMENAGLKFTDASGRLLPLVDIVRQLEPHAEDAGLFMELFGQRAGPAMAALVSKGADELVRMTDLLENSTGRAAEVSAVQMEGFNGVMKEVSSVFEALQIAIGDSGLLEWAQETGMALRDWIAAIAEASPEILKWGTIVAAAAAAIGPLLIGLGLALTAFAAVSAPVWGAIAAVSALSAAILYFWDDIQPFVTGFASSIAEAVGPAVTEAIASLTESFRSIRETIGEAFSVDLNGTVFSQSMQTLLDFLANRLVTGVQLALNTIMTAVRVFSETVTAITALFQGDFQGAFDAVMSAGQAFASGFISMIEIVLGDVRGFATQLLDIFRAIPGQMLQIGKDIMTGLRDGITSMAGSVVESARGVASRAYNSVTGFFDINSPSRVMHGVGVNVMQGFGNGMDSMAGPVANSAQSIASTIGGAFSGIIDGTKSVKDAVADMLKSIASSMLNSQIQSLFAGIGGGGFLGNLLGSVFKGLPGFANGGKFDVGGAGGIDSQLVAFRASPNETVSITKPGQERARSAQVSVQVVNNTGVQADARTERQSDGSISVILDKMQADNLTRRGTASNNALRQGFGAQPALKRR